MSRKTHTEGKWEIGKYEPIKEEGGGQWQIDSPDGAWHGLMTVFHTPDSYSEGHANAKLIAAAPEMLEALTAYDEVLLFKEEFEKGSQQHTDAINHFNDLRKKAIKKATA